MKIHRFIGDFKLKIGDFKLEDEGLFNQAKNVLKLKIGEKIILGDGLKNEGIAEIKEYGRDSVRVEIVEIQENKNEPESDVSLYCAILKRENFELVVQKATEIGVREIVPIITARTLKLDVRKDRLEKIIKEAAEQSGRGTVPVLRDPVDIEEVIKEDFKNQLNLFFDKSGLPVDRSESFEELKRLSYMGRIGVWIGPEGGWTDQEVESVGRSNFKIINLGKLTLRAETAAIVATYIVVNNFYCR